MPRNVTHLTHLPLTEDDYLYGPDPYDWQPEAVSTEETESKCNWLARGILWWVNESGEVDDFCEIQRLSRREEQ